MLNIRNHKKKVMNRKWVIQTLIWIMLCGLLFGGVMASVLTMDMIKDYMTINISVCILICMVMMIVLWTPLFIANRQINDIQEDGLYYVPAMSMLGQWKMIFYILCNNDIDVYLKYISFSEIHGASFGVERKYGGWGFSRYTYVIKLDMKEALTIYINPIDNGVLVPSGRGGFVLSGYKSRAEICNLMLFFEQHGVHVEDAYHILDALKREDIEIYDYLESLHLKTKY